jgi:trypsin
VRVHPDADIDIAVLRLSSPSAQTPLRWAGPEDAALYEPGTMATVTGWGNTQEGGGSTNMLREAFVPVVSDTTCNQAYSGGVNGPTEVCAGNPEGGVDTCQGDSGGPMIVPDGASWVLIGATSWGEGCARPNRPGVYAELAAADAFIAGLVG